jgi:hypothetical protein
MRRYTVLVGKSEGKTPLRKYRRRWKGNIEMDLKEIWLEGVDWIYLAENRDLWRLF